MINPKLFTVESLLEVLLEDKHFQRDTRNDTWRKHAEIVPDYMPPYPQKDTRPTCQVRCGDAWLRYSRGPKQGFFWDIYGDDFGNPALALMALLQAPVPTFFLKHPDDALKDSEGFGSVTFTLPRLK